MLAQISFVAPSRIDFERTKRMQAALGEIEGSARPVHEGFAGNEIFKVQARLFD
jgi:hypothetical protein